MNEVVERVARAILSASSEISDSQAEDAAILAIRALREPTPGMLEAVVRYPAELVAERNDPTYTRNMQAATIADRAAAADMFSRMIDAILKETDNG